MGTHATLLLATTRCFTGMLTFERLTQEEEEEATLVLLMVQPVMSA